MLGMALIGKVHGVVAGLGGMSVRIGMNRVMRLNWEQRGYPLREKYVRPRNGYTHQSYIIWVLLVLGQQAREDADRGVRGGNAGVTWQCKSQSMHVTPTQARRRHEKRTHTSRRVYLHLRIHVPLLRNAGRAAGIPSVS